MSYSQRRRLVEDLVIAHEDCVERGSQTTRCVDQQEHIITLLARAPQGAAPGLTDTERDTLGWAVTECEILMESAGTERRKAYYQKLRDGLAALENRLTAGTSPADSTAASAREGE